MANPPVPVTITERRTNIRNGRTEIWGAIAPGWLFDRTEDPDTPWYATCIELDLFATFSSLLQARTAAANGLREVLIHNARRTTTTIIC